ncbi:hypothetical protein Sme01_36690 [Sphaerisporangium melleum]|nr:hypothetical protein Sme01_36690 [Sphaerisporangium melleum]
MDESADPRVNFARRLRALQKATGLSVRRMEVESERTPRRRREDRLRLKRSTIAGMTSLERPVRPELSNFEVFVDTCLRVAAENDIALPPDLADRRAWDEAYRELREQVDRNPRRPAPRSLPERPARPQATISAEPGEAAEDNAQRPPLLRRRILLTTSVLAVAAAGAGIPYWFRGTRSPTAAAAGSPSPGTFSALPPGEGAYSPVGKLLSPPLGKDNPVWSVAVGWLRGEPVAVVGRADGTVQLWNPVTGRARSGPLAGHDKPVYSIALRPPIAVSGGVDGTLRVWDLTADPPTSTRMSGEPTGGINSVALAVVGGRTVAVSAGDDRTVRIWDPAVPRHGGEILGASLDSEVKSIATGQAMAVSGSADGKVRLWDLAAERVVRLLGTHESTVGTVAMGVVRGRLLAVSGSEDGVVRVWDPSGTEPADLGEPIHNAVKTVAIGTVKGRTVAIAGSDDSAIRIWDLATARPYGDGLTGPGTAAESIAIGQAGGRALVVSGHWDGTIWTWSP